MAPKNQRKTIEGFIDLAMSNQMICSSCQTNESEDRDGLLTIQRTMPEVLKGLRVPKKYWERVASSLTCFSCGTPLNITSDVGTKTNEERREERRQDKLTIPEGRFNHFGQCVFYLPKPKRGRLEKFLIKRAGWHGSKNLRSAQFLKYWT